MNDYINYIAVQDGNTFHIFHFDLNLNVYRENDKYVRQDTRRIVGIAVEFPNNDIFRFVKDYF